MSLSERLQRARTQQLIEAGLLTSEHALKPDDDAAPGSAPTADVEGQPGVSSPTAEGLFTPVTFEVQPSGLHLVAEAPRDLGDIQADGEATSCPNCNGHARLDMVDLVGHTMHYTCETCGAMWQIRKPPVDLDTGRAASS